jgi:hypothetical protein
MSKDNRARANFHNAQKSTGPQTPDGKAAVAQNRSIHNLTGDRVLLEGEDPAEFDELAAALLDEYQPVGQTESFLVEQILHNQYRLTRIAEMEQEIFTRMMNLSYGDATPATRVAGYMAFKLGTLEAHARLMRYETSIRRAYHQAVTQLRTVQNNRKRDADAKKKLSEQAEESATAEGRAEISDLDRTPALYPIENESCDSNPIPPVPTPEINPTDHL